MDVSKIAHLLQSPVTGKEFTGINGEEILFGSEKFQLISDIPVLIDEAASLFEIDDLRKNKITTQSKIYNSNLNWKNRLRRAILPQITHDYHFETRYRELAKNVQGKNILVIGTGAKTDYYRQLFSGANVILTDVHIQFDIDLVVDAHKLPFADQSLDMIIAGQVMEHTIRPWVVANEMQRVIKPGGLIHIESPMCFSFHAIPYDFYRFTFMGMRSLFPLCKISKAFITEAGGNTAGLVNSEVLINSFSGRYSRRAATIFSRFAFGWFKWFDKFKSIESHKLNRWALPMGIGMTFESDKYLRNDKELMQDFYAYFKSKA